AFLFPGQGAQYPGMGREVYDGEPVFRRWVDHGCRVLEEPLGLDLREVLFPGPEVGPERAAERLRQTRYAQPALFVVEYALARLWREWGIEPRAMLGHSLGEWTAAAVAEVFELDDALRLVALRGRLMQAMEPGAMINVQLGEEAVEPFLGGGIELAAVNAPDLCSLSGPEPAVAALAGTLEGLGIGHRRLHTSHAFHSAMMDPAVRPLVEAVAAVERRAPRIPFVSNVSGRWIGADEAQDPSYWGRQLRSAVRFADGAAELATAADGVFLEVGPGRTLASLARRSVSVAGADVVTSLPPPGDAGTADEALMAALGRLWLAGADPDWSRFYQGQRRAKVELPTYPFERQRYWVEPGRGLPVSGLEGKRADVGQWFYLPSWRRSASLAPPPAAGVGPWLLVADEVGVVAALAEELRRAGETVSLVRPGDACHRLDAETYTVAVTDEGSWRELWRRLDADGRAPRRWLHGLAVDPLAGDLQSGGRGDSAEAFRAAQETGQGSLLALARALAEESGGADLEGVVLTSGLHRLDGRDPIEPAKAPLLGVCRVLPQEYPHLGCRAVDLDRPSAWTGGAAVAQLADELWRDDGEAVVAFRGGRRWVQEVEATPLPPVTGVPRRLREGGVYLITGGLGGVGLVLARYLAESVGAKLVLVGRSKFPPPEAWLGWLLEHGGAGAVCRKILELQNMQEAGSELLLLRADVADEAQMDAAVATAVERFGRLDGVFHCAGVAGQEAFQPIQLLTPERCAEQLHPKAYGTMVLHRVLERRLGDDGPDFVLVMSSIAGVLGGRFFAAYAGANLAADALVQRYRETAPGRWLSVAWDGWRLDGAMPDNEVSELAMSPEEGVEALRRILGVEPQLWSEQPVIVSTGELGERRRRWLDRERLRAQGPTPLTAGEGHARPSLSTAFKAPSSSAETLLAGIWCTLLGLDEVGVDDDFF
ncbi:MAG: SDR family oxidoreductase, partial [Acidobacteria bacterium]|nr:SDR family oxidoreductase [Acidobacteriota bacterium]